MGEMADLFSDYAGLAEDYLEEQMAKFVTMEVSVGARTDKAVELTFHPDTKHEQDIWVPLSVLEDADEIDNIDDNGLAMVSIAKWFLKKSDIEYDIDEDIEDEDAYASWGDRS